MKGSHNADPSFESEQQTKETKVRVMYMDQVIVAFENEMNCAEKEKGKRTQMLAW